MGLTKVVGMRYASNRSKNTGFALKQKDTKDMTKVLIPTIESTTVEIGFDAEAREAVAQLAKAKLAKAEAEKIIAEADAVLRDKMGNAQIATVGGVPTLKMVTVNRKDINRKKLETDFKEIFNAVTYENPYQFIKAI